MTCKELAEKLLQTPDKPLYISVDADGGEYLFPLDCDVAESTVENKKTGSKRECVVIEAGELPALDYGDIDEEDEDYV